MLSSLDVLQRLNDEALTFICVAPTGLSGAFMVKHISIWDKSISLNTLHLDSEDATGDHHSNLRVLFQRELTIVWHLIAYSIVVLLNVSYFFSDLILEGTALEPGSFLLGVENGEIIESFWQYIDVFVEE